MVTPGASSAAAICLVPAFLVAPAMRTEPCSGRPARTTRESVIAARSLREAQREVVLELGPLATRQTETGVTIPGIAR